MVEEDNLQAYADPDNYDLEDPSDIGVAFYSALAQETGGPVLELGCGTGRVSVPIARLGLDVTGLDIVPGMLAKARGKSVGLPIEWVEGDARAFDLGRQFRLIFLTGNTFQAFLTRTDQEALLRNVRAHLQDEGLLAFETRNPRWANMTGPEDERSLSQPDTGLFAFLETRDQEQPLQTYYDVKGREIRVSLSQTYDHVGQILHWTSYRRCLEGSQLQTSVSHIAVRFTFPQELEALLHNAGFTIVRQYGDWDLEPLSAASPSIIVVCRKSS